MYPATRHDGAGPRTIAKIRWAFGGAKRSRTLTRLRVFSLRASSLRKLFDARGPSLPREGVVATEDGAAENEPGDTNGPAGCGLESPPTKGCAESAAPAERSAEGVVATVEGFVRGTCTAGAPGGDGGAGRAGAGGVGTGTGGVGTGTGGLGGEGTGAGGLGGEGTGAGGLGGEGTGTGGGGTGTVGVVGGTGTVGVGGGCAGAVTVGVGGGCTGTVTLTVGNGGI